MRPVISPLTSAISIASTLIALSISEAAPPTKDAHCGRAASARRLITADPCIAEGLMPPPPLNPELAADTDVLHYDLTVDIDFATNTIDGYNVMTVKSLVDGLATFDIRIRSNFALSDLTVDGVAATYTRIDVPTISVTLPRTYSAGEIFTLTIGWNGAPASRGFGSFEFDTHGGVEGAFSLSEPYYAYTWWAAKDENTDKTTADLHFIIPSNFVAASNGVLGSVDNLGSGRAQYNWHTDYPIAPYLISIGATNFNRFSSVFEYDGHSMPVEFFIYPEKDSQANRNGWLRCVDMLGTYSDIYGIYPFINEKYGIYNFVFGGGMEHQTMTGQSDFGESLTAHELAHQWWGDNVTCETWSDIWENEGFATYSECLWEEYKNGGDDRGALRNAINSRRPFSFGNSVYVFDTTDINRIFDTSSTYYKGAWVLHMLRRIVGDSDFFAILAAHRAANEGGTATSAEFQATAESVYGASLDWFFGPWLYEPGAISWRYNYRSIILQGQHYGEVMLKQTQTTNWPTFTMPVDIRLNTSAGPQNFTVPEFARKQHFLFPLPAAPTSLTVDPDSWVLTDTRGTAAFEESPPKVIASFPVDGEQFKSSSYVPVITVAFQKTINTPTEADFSLTGARTGPHPFTVSWRESTLSAALNLDGSPLPPDTYTFVVKDSIRDSVSGQQLDGDLPGSSTASVYPSGDGVPGGPAVIQFTIGPAKSTGSAQEHSPIDVKRIDR